MNIADIVRVHAQRMPQQPALLEGRDSLDWAGLQARIEAAHARLQAHGVRTGDVVAISLRHAVPGIVLALAAARAGAVWLVLDWRQRTAERTAALQAISPRLLVEDRPAAAAGATETVSASELLAPPDGRERASIASSDPELVAAIILSSGTTGLPKAVTVTHRALAWRGAIIASEDRLRPGTRVLHALPLAASAAVSNLLGQLLAGATGILQPPIFSPSELVERINALAIGTVSLVPTMVRGMLGLADARSPLLPGLSALIALGSAFHAEEKQAAMRCLTPHLFERYGATGAGPICTATPADLARHPGTVGHAAPMVRVDIVDADGRTVPAGGSGRVRVRTPGAASGYVLATADGEQDERFEQGFVYPGDIGRKEADGLLVLTGRQAQLIIRGGQNIAPGEIESVLLAHPLVVEAAVIGRPDPHLGEVPVALIVTRGKLAAGELDGHCRARLQPYKVPLAFHLVEALPRTAAGKIRHADLAAMLRDR